MQCAKDISMPPNTARISIGIVARNEEAGIGETLKSLFAQSIFAELERRGWACEIICLANGCTDRTAEVVAKIFEANKGWHAYGDAFSARVVELRESGKINAWNQFVHAFSARDAETLFLLDADILIHCPETLWNMWLVLESDPQAHIAVDRPRKGLYFKRRKSLWDRVSLTASRLTSSGDTQLCGQLYGIRAHVARNIYLPKDLAACEDGFIKTMVCTDFLTRPPSTERIRLAEKAEHTFEAYATPSSLLKNQKRQIIGQTIVHILVDKYLKNRPPRESERLAETLRDKDSADPEWLKRLIQQHLEKTKFWWRLYPGMGVMGFKRLKRLKPLDSLICLPAAVAGSSLALISGLMAFKALKAGCTNYWPQVQRQGMGLANS